MKPITAKEYCVSHYSEYPFKMENKTEMLALLNILQANDETLDSMHDVVFNGCREFMDIFGEWDTVQELYDTILQFNMFLSESEFIDWILEKLEELKYEGFDDSVDEIRTWTYDDEISDTKVIKTEDGYVIRVWY